MKQTFEQWKAKVNSAIESSVGLSSDDLPDCCYRDWYEANVTPSSAAKRAIRAANE